MIEQTARDYVKQAYRDGKKPSFYAAEKSLKRGMIWQVMEECRYNQTEAAQEMGVSCNSPYSTKQSTKLLLMMSRKSRAT